MERKVLVNTKDSWSRTDYISEAIVETDGAIKWSSNGRYLGRDTMEKIIANGFTDFSVVATNVKREIQVEEELAEYRRNYKGPSQEELVEMRAAYGKGATVVNVITGEVIKL